MKFTITFGAMALVMGIGSYYNYRDGKYNFAVIRAFMAGFCAAITMSTLIDNS